MKTTQHSLPSSVQRGFRGIRSTYLWVALAMSFALLLGACAPVAPAPAAQTPSEQAPAEEAASGEAAAGTEAIVNSVGVELPPDAAPLEEQVFRVSTLEGKHFDYNKNIYEWNGMGSFAWEPLVWPDADWNFYPGGADSWETSDDGLTWTFHLNQDAKWSDGSPVTAEDWAFTFRRELDPATASTYAWFYYGFKNAQAVNQGEMPVDELGVEAVDDYTLTITTEQPLPYLLMILAFPTSFPVNKAMVEEHGDAWASNLETVLSNGPYMVTEWNKGRNLVMELNPEYSGPRQPKLEKIIQVFVPQGAPIMSMYQADEIDHMKTNLQADMIQIINDPVLSQQASLYANFVTRYIWFNHLEPPFDNKLVRQAISHAIDREAITEQVTQGMNVPGYTMLPPGFPCSSANNPEYQAYADYDPAQAADLLAQAGYPNGEGFPELEMWTKQGEAIPEMEAIQRMLQDNLGIKVIPKDVERAVYVDTLGQGNLKIAMGRWYFDYPDPTNFLNWWRGTDGIIKWDNPQFDEIVTAAGGELDPQKRCEMYAEAEKIMLEDVAAVFIEHPKEVQLFKPNIAGIKLRSDGIKHDYTGMVSDLYITKQ